MLMSAELKGCVTWFIYFLDLLWVRYNCAKFHHCRICVTDFREGGNFWPPPPIRKQPWKNPSWIGLDFVTVGSWGSFPSKSFYGLFTWATFSFFLKKLQTSEANYPSSSIHLTLKPLIKSDLKYFTFQSVSLYLLFSRSYSA